MGQVRNPLMVEKGLRATFMKAFMKAQSPKSVMDMIMETGSTGSSEKYAWFGQSPEMQVWADKRQVKGLRDSSFIIKNIPYEATLGVDRDDLEDDQLGGIKIRINDLAKKAKGFVKKLFYTKLLAGETDLCYDGQPFFSASHEEGESGTQSNLLTHTYAGTLPTIAELEASFDASVTALMEFKDDNGELINDDDDLKLKVVCSTALRGLFRKLLRAEMISSTTNTMVGAADLTVSARLSGAPYYVAVTGENVKPFVLQTRRGITFASQKDGNSDDAFDQKIFKYGVDARYGFDYGLWQLMVKMSKA